HRDRRWLWTVRREERGGVGEGVRAGRDCQCGLQRDRPPHEGSAHYARQDSGGARMKTLSNATARDIRQAIQLSSDARQRGRSVSFAGGGSYLLALVKERIVSSDVI